MGGEGAGAGILRRLTRVDGEHWRREVEIDNLVDCLLAAKEEQERVVGMVAGVVVWGGVSGSFSGWSKKTEESRWMLWIACRLGRAVEGA